VFKTLYYHVVTEEKRKEKTCSPLTPRIGLDLIDPQYNLEGGNGFEDKDFDWADFAVL
jgi:hypothetical protein